MQLNPALAQLGRNLRAMPPAPWPWLASGWRGALVGLIAAAGAVTHRYESSLFVALGAFCVILIDPTVPRGTYHRAIAAVSVSVSLTAFIAGVAGGSWLLLPLLVVFAYSYGAYSSSPLAGPAAFGAAMLGLLIAIAVGQSAKTGVQALQLAALILIGCAIGAAVDAATWRWERGAFLRRRVDVAVAKVRLFGQNGNRNNERQLVAARAELDLRRVATAARLPMPAREVCFEAIDSLEELRLAIANWLAAAPRSVAERASVAAAVRPVAARGGSCATDSPPVSDGESSLFSVIGRAQDRVARFRQVSWQLTADAPAERADAAAWSRFIDDVKEVCAPRTLSGRHGIRMALGIAVAECVNLVTGLAYGEWIAVAVVYLLKADFAATLTRGILRLIGTVAAIVFVGLIVHATDANIAVLVVMIAISCALAMRWGVVNYGVASFAIAAAVLFFITTPGDTALEATRMRLLNTFIGVFVALIAHFVVPSWKGPTLAAALVLAVEAVRDWQQAVLAGLSLPAQNDATVVRAAGTRARDAVFAALPVAEAAMLEPRRAAGGPVDGLELLGNLRRAAVPLLSLEYAANSFAGSPSSGEAEPPRLAAAAAATGRQLEQWFSQMLIALDGRAAESVSESGRGLDFSAVGDDRFDPQLEELVGAISDARQAAVSFTRAKQRPPSAD